MTWLSHHYFSLLPLLIFLLACSFHHRHRAQSIIQFQSLDQLEDEVTKGFYETTPPREGSRKRVVIMEVLCGNPNFKIFTGFSY